MPEYIEHKFPGLPDVSAFYRLNSLIESILNALPQSVLQTRFYLLGNTPKGLDQYITQNCFCIWFFAVNANIFCHWSVTEQVMRLSNMLLRLFSVHLYSPKLVPLL